MLAVRMNGRQLHRSCNLHVEKLLGMSTKHCGTLQVWVPKVDRATTIRSASGRSTCRQMVTCFCYQGLVGSASAPMGKVACLGRLLFCFGFEWVLCYLF